MDWRMSFLYLKGSEVVKIKKGMEKEVEKGKKVNQDPYGSCVYRYLERWADLMEAKIEEHKDKTPKEVIAEFADELSYEADTEGITGLMYGCAVSLLSQAWEYGEDLRVWHNKEYGYEGDGCVNPAVLSIR